MKDLGNPQAKHEIVARLRLTRPEMAQDQGGTPPGAFERDRVLLLSTIDRFTAPGRDFDWHPHPLFGSMRESDWMRWGYLHADHHLRQFGL